MEVALGNPGREENVRYIIMWENECCRDGFFFAALYLVLHVGSVLYQGPRGRERPISTVDERSKRKRKVRGNEKRALIPSSIITSISEVKTFSKEAEWGHTENHIPSRVFLRSTDREGKRCVCVWKKGKGWAAYFW